jgi:pyridinium-3,5-bisthiocarboxylic acid mononucleotide nickel chelatase
LQIPNSFKIMQLLIDPSGGFTGNMFAAAIISAGADPILMTDTMYKVAAKIGKASVKDITGSDGATCLQIEVDPLHSRLSMHEAQHLLAAMFEELDMDPTYRTFGQYALQLLVDALKQSPIDYSPAREHLHDHHHQPAETYLHKAQDILIDITGAAYGLQLLEAPVEATLLAPVPVGVGNVDFSAGSLDVPTLTILHDFGIPTQPGPTDQELCTCTGAAILAALKATKLIDNRGFRPLLQGTSKGCDDLPLPMLKIYLTE